MRLKRGVKLNGLRPEALMAVVIIDSAFLEDRELPEFVITSVMDGKHSIKSSHWKGEAFDMRSRELNAEQSLSLHENLVSRLGNDFDLVIETDHWHCEWDPEGKP